MTNNRVDSGLKQYLVITGSYWAFTLTDGALRMLVVLYFHQIGYSPLEIASLFLFYEFFGIITNLTGGWLGARIGLTKVLNIGLILQVLALTMLLVPTNMLGIIWVMSAQALSGIAKDLNKTSAKSSVKLFVEDGETGRLYRWVSALTGSKNTITRPIICRLLLVATEYTVRHIGYGHEAPWRILHGVSVKYTPGITYHKN